MTKPEASELLERLMLNLAKTHDRSVGHGERGAYLALKAGSGIAETYWRAQARTALRTLRARSETMK